MKQIINFFIILIITQFVSIGYGQKALIPVNGDTSKASYMNARVTRTMIQESNRKGWKLFNQPYDGVFTRFKGKNDQIFEFVAISDPYWKRIVAFSGPQSEINIFKRFFNEKGKRNRNLKILKIRGVKLAQPTGMDLRHYGDTPEQLSEAWLAIADKGARKGKTRGSVYLCKVKFKNNGKFSIKKIHEFTGLNSPTDVALDVYGDTINVFVCDEGNEKLVWFRYDQDKKTSIQEQIEIEGPLSITRTTEDHTNNCYFIYSRYYGLTFLKMDNDSTRNENYSIPNIVTSTSQDPNINRFGISPLGRGIPLQTIGEGAFHSVLWSSEYDDGLVTTFLTKNPDEDSLTYEKAQIAVSRTFNMNENPYKRSSDSLQFNGPKAVFHSSQPAGLFGPGTGRRNLGEIYILERYSSDSGIWKLNLSSQVTSIKVELNKDEEDYLRKGYIEIIKPTPIIPKRYDICVDSMVIVSGKWDNPEDHYYSNPGISRIFLDDMKRPNELNHDFLYNYSYSNFKVILYYDQFYEPYGYGDSYNLESFSEEQERVVSGKFQAGKIELKEVEQVEKLSIYQPTSIEDSYTVFNLSWPVLRTSEGSTIRRYQVRWKSLIEENYNTRFVYRTSTSFDLNSDPGFVFHEPTEFWVRGISNDPAVTPPPWMKKTILQSPTFTPDSISFLGSDPEGNFIFRIFRHPGDRAEEIKLYYGELRSDGSQDYWGFGSTKKCLPGEAYTDISAGVVIAHRPAHQWEMRAFTIIDEIESKPLIQNFSFHDYTSEGSVTSHEIWHAEESNGNSKTIHITGPLTIEESGQIVVERGANIIFDPDASLTIKGKFRCLGHRKSNEINIKSAVDGVRYGPIEFIGSSGKDLHIEYTNIEGCEALIVNPATKAKASGYYSSKIRNCKFLYSGNELGTIHVIGCEAYLYGNEISASVGNAIYLSNSSGRIVNNRILHPKGRGIYLKNSHGTIISNNFIKGCGGSGIDLNDCLAVTLTENVILKCSDSGLLVKSSNPLIYNNSLVKNSGNNIVCGDGSYVLKSYLQIPNVDEEILFRELNKYLYGGDKGEILLDFMTGSCEQQDLFADNTEQKNDLELEFLKKAILYESRSKYGFASLEYLKLLQKNPKSIYATFAFDRYVGNRIRLHGLTQWTLPPKEMKVLVTIVSQMNQNDEGKALNILKIYELAQKNTIFDLADPE